MNVSSRNLYPKNKIKWKWKRQREQHIIEEQGCADIAFVVLPLSTSWKKNEDVQLHVFIYSFGRDRERNAIESKGLLCRKRGKRWSAVWKIRRDNKRYNADLFPFTLLLAAFSPKRSDIFHFCLFKPSISVHGDKCDGTRFISSLSLPLFRVHALNLYVFVLLAPCAMSDSLL